MSKRKKIALGCFTILVVGGVIVWFSPAADAVRDILKTGVLEDKPIDAKYEGDSKARLKALQIAALSYHQSEEVFPSKEKWMDDLMTRLKTSDLREGEAERKLIRPDLENQPGKFGYAMNAGIAGKYKGDIPDTEMILFFECKVPVRHCVGDPKVDGVPSGLAVTLSGNITNLP